VSSTFFGHPRGLATLFFTEMWERFTYYGMRALLVLFLVAAVSSGGFGIDDKAATAIYGLYTAAAYLAALPGGWIADRLIGARRAVLIGGITIALGNGVLALAGNPTGFFLGLVVVVIGVGLLKPNVSAMVADLYPEGGAHQDAGFTLFYIGINVGSFLGPLVTGAAQEFFGPRAGFAAAGLFMGVGVLQFVLTRRYLGTAGLYQSNSLDAAQPARLWSRLWLGLGVFAAVLLAFALGWVSVAPVTLARYSAVLIFAISLLYFAFYLFFGGLTPMERGRGIVLIVLFLGSAAFWAGYEQAGSSLNIFAERYTDRLLSLLHFTIPTEWFQSLNPFFIIVFAPFVAWTWVALARRRLDPSVPAKFAIGVILMGLGFLVMVAAATLVVGGSKVSPNWLIFTYLLHTVGELCLSPVGVSYFTKLTPKRYTGQMVGMWFLSISLGNIIAGLIAGLFNADDLAAMPGQYLRIVYFSVGLGLLLLVLSKPVKKLMGGMR
jgi:POT family proton-dependent oligopeptide transporter